MHHRSRFALGLALLATLALFLPLPAHAAKFLFDGTKSGTAGNADWVIDADAWDYVAGTCLTPPSIDARPQRYPTPDQSTVNASTPETYWTGGISSWGIDLVKAGHTVEGLPPGTPITFNDGSNPQDLSNYDVFISVEPNVYYTAAEKTAILNFVSAGGGLFMVADHSTSDRNCDGNDAPMVWDDLMGSTSGSSAGVFGIWFMWNVVDSEDWFNEGVCNNVETDPADPIIYGPFGSGAGGLGLFGATSMTLNLTNNPTAKGHVWRLGQAHGTDRVTFATAEYGAGRVAAIGDSSPADDGTGDPGDTLHLGWTSTVGGIANRQIHLNACAWLLGTSAPDTTPPTITAGPASAPSDCTATITWTTDEIATSNVDYGLTTSYGSTATTPGNVTSHSVVVGPPLTAGTLYHYQVRTADGSGNLTTTGDFTFTTAAAANPVITLGPAAGPIGGTTATITWTTDEPSTSVVEYGLTVTYGSSSSSSTAVAAHSVALSSLSPMTTYHYRVGSTDSCGNGPVWSGDFTFSTGSPAYDLSGWKLREYSGGVLSYTYTIPAGTTIPSGGYLVVGRDATEAEFRAYYTTMPAEALYLDSNGTGACANGCIPMFNGGKSWDLVNPADAVVDGPTISTATGNSYQRTNPGDPAGVAGSWTTVARTSANPGSGVGTLSGAGVRLNELADASDYTKEFLELFYDAGGSGVTASPSATPSSRCASATSQLHAGPAGGTPPYSYLWTPATGLDSATIENPVSSATVTTTYNVVVTDSASASSASTQVSVTVSNPVAVPTANPTTVCQGAGSLLSANPAGGVGEYTYAWTPATGLSATNVATPTATPTTTTVYSVVVTDSLGCASSAGDVTVTVSGLCAPEISGTSVVPFRFAEQPSDNFTANFEWVPSVTYHVYGFSGLAAMDAGDYGWKWCNLASSTVGSFSNDGTTATWSALPNASFSEAMYLVVAEQSSVEGSYGKKSTGAERTKDADKSAAGGWCPGVTPTCSITSPTGTQIGNVSISYTAVDTDSATLTATFHYSTDGSTWILATAASGSSNPATVAPGARTFGWASATDIPTSAATVYFRVTVADASTNSTCTTSAFAVNNAASSCVGHVVISQVYGGGGNSGASYNQDFIELFNCSSSAVNIGDWSVQYASATGSSWANKTNIPTGTMIGAKSYYLVGGASGATGSALPTPDVTGTINLSNTAGKVALVNNTTALTGTCPLPNAVIIDLIGFGSTASCKEGTAAASTTGIDNTKSTQRKSAGCTDTDQNGSDFEVLTTTPRNSASPSHDC
jgi:hypothetical protein